MANNADRAQGTMDQLESKILAVRKHVPNIKPKGTCHYCKDEVNELQLFCDGDCAGDYERLTPANVSRI